MYNSEERSPLLGGNSHGGLPIKETPRNRDAATAIKSNVKKQYISWGAAFLAFMKSNMGVGVLAYPFGFKSDGWAASIMISVLVSTVALIGMFGITDARQWVINNNPGSGDNWYVEYPELTKLTVGLKTSRAVFLAVIWAQLSCVISYMIFITNVLHRMLFAYIGAPRWLYILFLLPIYIPLGLLPSLKKIAPLAPLGLFLGFAGAVLVIFFGFQSTPEGLGKPFKPEGIMTMIGISFFATEAVNQVVGINAAMAEPRKFKGMLFASVSIVCGLYILFGVIVLYLFGEETSSIITRNMNLDAMGNSASICFAAYLICTFPFQLFPAANVIVFSIKGSLEGNRNSRSLCSRVLVVLENIYVLRLSLVTFCGIVAAYLKDLGHFADLTGYPCMTFLGVVIPASMMISIDSKSQYRYLSTGARLMWWGLAVLGSVLAICGTGYSVMQLGRGENDNLEVSSPKK